MAIIQENSGRIGIGTDPKSTTALLTLDNGRNNALDVRGGRVRNLPAAVSADEPVRLDQLTLLRPWTVLDMSPVPGLIQLSELDASEVTGVVGLLTVPALAGLLPNGYFQNNGYNDAFVDTTDGVLLAAKIVVVGNDAVLGTGDVFQLSGDGTNICFIMQCYANGNYVPFSTLQQAFQSSGVSVLSGFYKERDNGDGTATLVFGNILLTGNQAYLFTPISSPNNYGNPQDIYVGGIDIAGNPGQIYLDGGSFNIMVYCPTTGTPPTNSPQNIGYLQLGGPINICGVVTIPLIAS